MHYICTAECEGVSDKPGTCQAETCSKHGKPLVACDCTDNKHEGRQHSEDKSDDAKPARHE